MGMIGEFKEFISKGNVLDLAVGVVIGAAFGKIVTALVDGIVMPIVGVALGGVSVSDWKYVMKPETVDAAGAKVAEVAVRYGMFIQTLIDFLPDARNIGAKIVTRNMRSPELICKWS